MATNLSKLDQALNVIAEEFFDPIKSGNSDEVRNRHAFAQKQVLQAIAWKCNQQLDQTVDVKVDAARSELTELAAKGDNTEIGIQMVQRAAANFDFWETQQLCYMGLMDAASRCMARHGHGEYVRSYIKPRQATVADDAKMEDAKLAAILSRAGVTPQPKVTKKRDGEGSVS